MKKDDSIYLILTLGLIIESRAKTGKNNFPEFTEALSTG